MRDKKREASRKYWGLGAKYECMEHYSKGPPICAKCGCHDLRKLQLDHGNNDGKEHRDQMVAEGRRLDNTTSEGFYRYLYHLGYPDDLGLQVLCAECNYHKERPKRMINFSVSIEFSPVEPIANVQVQSLWEM